MKVKYLPSFIKDLKSLKSTSVYDTIQKIVFEEIPAMDNFNDLVGIKRLKSNSNAYRIRVGDYRIGFFCDGEIITFARVLHRREIYRYFPEK